MAIQFNNILAPADLSVNTGIAVKKALEIAGPGATIHLLHIQEISFPRILISSFKNKTIPRDAEIQNCLQQWRTAIEETGKDFKVCIWTVPGSSVQKVIEKFSLKISADLIVIGKKRHHNWATFRDKVICSKLVEKTGITVLSVKPGSFHNKARKLIVPLETKIPEEKMQIIIGISKKYKLKIYLVSFVAPTESNPGHHAVSLMHTHRWLSTSIGCPVEYTVLNRSEGSKALLNYTRKVDGNILLLFAGVETGMGVLKADIADAVLPNSNIEIFIIKKQASGIN